MRDVSSPKDDGSLAIALIERSSVRRFFKSPKFDGRSVRALSERFRTCRLDILENVLGRRESVLPWRSIVARLSL